MKNPFILIAIVFGLAFVGYTLLSPPSYLPMGDLSLAKEAGIKEITITGKFDPEQHAVKNLPTIFVFCTKHCPGCQAILGDHLPKLLAIRPDIAVRSIVVPSGWSTSGMQNLYGISMKSTPHLVIVGKDGKLFMDDSSWFSSAKDFFYKWLNFELKDEWERKMKSSGR